MQKTLQYLQENKENYLKILKDFLSIPSISTDSAYNDQVQEAANFLKKYISEIGFDNVKQLETGNHPVVYAEYLQAGPDAPTVLIYGHYDVQPVDPIEHWDSNPFQAEVRDGRLYARGSSDDKGQVFMHLAVFDAILKAEGKLPINVKLCIEGEEEIGSANFKPVLIEHQELLKADFAVVSDTSMITAGQPTILYGLKGLTGLEFTVTSATHDLHSGMYGGAVRNPLMTLAHILSTMKNEEEVVTVDGFYDGIEELSDEERALIAELEGENYQETTGAIETVSEQGYSAKEHTMARPTLEVNGMHGGYQGEGTKTIIPAYASAKITCRLVPGQDPEHIQNLLEKHILEHTPSGVKVTIEKGKVSAKSYKVEPDHPLIKQAASSYAKAFGKECVFMRMGGSIPVVEWFDEVFAYPIILLGFGTPEDRLHSPNESFPLENFEKGMETLVYYWEEVAN